MSKKEPIPQWCSKLSIWVNDRTGGPKGYSLCARFWENRLNGHWHGRVMSYLADTLIFWDKQHARKAYLRRRKI